MTTQIESSSGIDRNKYYITINYIIIHYILRIVHRSTIVLGQHNAQVEDFQNSIIFFQLYTPLQ